MKNSSGHKAWISTRMKSWGAEQNLLVANPSGSVVVAFSRSEAFEGRGQPLPRPVLGMCTAGGGRTWKKGNGYRFNDVWQPGKVGLAIPSPALEGRTPDMAGVFISFDMDAVPFIKDAQLTGDHLTHISRRLYDDPLATSVMTALWHEAEIHGLSSTFFEQGLSNVIYRLSTLAGIRLKQNKQTLPLSSHSSLEEVFDLIEDRLGDDIRVVDMATWVGVDAKTLTRMFKRETGLTPFSYLTSRRMKRAKEMLQSDISVTETALAVGYTNPAKFAAAFRRSVGSTPTAWAKYR